MRKPHWTFRPGTITEADKAAIRGLTEINPAASQIFITGEVLGRRIGELNVDALLAVNDTLAEPLFVVTKERTIRMVRYDATKIWTSMEPAMFETLFHRETENFGVLPFQPSCFDFYESLFANGWAVDLGNNRKALFGHYVRGTATNDAYINALTLFGKPLYADIPASEFFSAHCPGPSFGNTTFIPADGELTAAVLKAHDGSKYRLTNAELELILNIN